MYVCVCRGFNETQVRRAAENCRSISELFRTLGGKPRCGKCVGAVRDLIGEVAVQPAGDAPGTSAG